MVGTSLAEAYRSGLIKDGDLVSIKTNGGTEQFLFLLYLEQRGYHMLLRYPPPENPIKREFPVLYTDVQIKEWEKIGHKEPEEFKKEVEAKKKS